MTPYDLCGPLPTGTTVLEASAGTGKTFTIAALTARYVAEGVADLSQVMLVTFGNAASRELRDRVRERLVSAERGLRDPAAARRGDDEVLAHLAGGTDEHVAVRRRRLADALAGFDAATIATTHSFCWQMLTALGTSADTDPSATFTDSVDDLVREVVDDLYLRQWGRPDAGPPPMTAAELLALGREAVRSSASARLAPDDATGTAQVRVRAAGLVVAEVAARKRRRGLVDYDDQLTLLRDALADHAHGQVARERVRSRYRVVLVDEFQDTDPVQWEVLRRAFAGSTALVLIGDPKQAIYAFRGGDVVTYLSARESATDQATLARNWRSDRALLDGLGVVLGGAALGDPRIVVRPVEAACPDRRLTGAGAPVRLRQVGRAGLGARPRGLPAVARVREAVAEDVAREVVALLSGPARLHLPDPADPHSPVGEHGRPVRPQDVAVLVRTHRQGAAVREALRRARVPAVLAGDGSVFATPAAVEWLVLLEALEQPHRPGRVRAAALSAFLGRTEAELDAGGEPAADELGGQLRGWAELLAGSGVAALAEVVAARHALAARVLARPDGDRLLTDLRHVGSALHTAALQESLGLTALVTWLRRRIATAESERSDERSRRLESDATAVQIMTVHVSKGLEFPVVHVPYAWDRWSPDRPDVLRLHEEDGARVLDVGGPSAPGYRAAREVHDAEESGEELRLLYVALTRAQCQVVAHWAPSKNTLTAPLHRLLLGPGTPGAVPVATVDVPADDAVAARLVEVAASSSGTVSAETVVPGDLPVWEPPAPPTAALSVRRFTRSLDTAWRRTSYSALTAGAHEQAAAGHGRGVASEPEEPGTVDEPATPPPGAAAVPGALEAPGTVDPGWALPSPFAGLPGGTSFGTLVHEVLEDPDPAQLDERCAQALARRPGTGIEPAALAAALRPVLATPLGPLGVPLGAVPAGDRLAELSFELPLAGDGQEAATLRDLAALLRTVDLGPLRDYPDLLDQLEPAALRGFLTGSIDAVLRRPGPSYAVVDHKTNRLGRDPLTAHDYRPEALVEEMLRSHYVLQALLYSVALHRFLRWRQPAYDPARHLGPVLYLFVRGMVGPGGPPGAGVFSWQPPPGLVVALSDLLGGRR